MNKPLEYDSGQQGWTCPKCGTVNAPFVPTCLGLKCQKKKSDDPVFIDEPYVPSYTTDDTDG